MRSAISNLVFNAANYTLKDGVIDITFSHDRCGGYLAIQDNGVGIEEHHLPHLTERFYRVDKSRHLKTGGTGLGLSIVKQVLVSHGAELKITSQPGKGSVFTCIFPVVAVVDGAASH